MLKKILIFLVLLVSLVSAATAQSIADAPIIFRSGLWYVKQLPRDTTPASPLICVAFYNDSIVSAQYASDTLYVDARPSGGVDSLALNIYGTDIIYGRHANLIEQRAGIVIFPNEYFRMLLSARGIRIAFFTFRPKPGIVDIIFDGLQDVYDYMRIAPSKCHTPVNVPPGVNEGE